MRGDRLAIVGPNGAGKTTLVRLLLGEIEADTGSIRLGANLAPVYLDQARADLRSDMTLWDALTPGGGDSILVRGQSKHVAAYAKDFLFKESQLRQPVSTLSGGERNRLLLARALAQPANLLVLDEPTNDLDMETLDRLEDLLEDYDGTLILVSHDRDFIDRLATSTIALNGRGDAVETPGGWTEFVRQNPGFLARDEGKGIREVAPNPRPGGIVPSPASTRPAKALLQGRPPPRRSRARDGIPPRRHRRPRNGAGRPHPLFRRPQALRQAVGRPRHRPRPAGRRRIRLAADRGDEVGARGLTQAPRG
jgi:ATP-binding cassette subfamily F protein uup